MTDDEALLAAIDAQPEEDTPRLVYADWLSEHGDEVRAEFIRVQCDLANKETLPRPALNRHVDLFKRNQELLDRHLPQLLGPFSALPPDADFEFRRGFVSQVELPVASFLAQVETIAAAMPRPKVCVSRVASRLRDFVTCPHLGCVTKISGFAHDFDYDNPALVWPSEADLQAIHRLSVLEILDLEGCNLGFMRLEWSRLREAVGPGRILPSLVDLDLSSNDLGDGDIIGLLETHLPAQLKRLVLGGNPIGDQGAIDLALGWPLEGPLEYLNLRFTNIGQAGQRALLARFGGKVDLF